MTNVGLADGCPLCGSDKVYLFEEAWKDMFIRCEQCSLTFRDPERWPSPEVERARYEQHENDPADPRYRAFLGRLAGPVAERTSRMGKSRPIIGLDFGCGSGPTLSSLLEEHGFEMFDYDPIFQPDRSALERAYDIITASEVFEHLHAPWSVLQVLDDLLLPGGLLGVMTEMVDDHRDFSSWSYARDPTHVCFYHERTMHWIARRRGWSLERPAVSVVMFLKPPKR